MLAVAPREAFDHAAGARGQGNALANSGRLGNQAEELFDQASLAGNVGWEIAFPEAGKVGPNEDLM
jgi:hypothetical protein